MSAVDIMAITVLIVVDWRRVGSSWKPSALYQYFDESPLLARSGYPP